MQMTASLTSVNQLDHVVFNFDPGPKRVPILYSTAIQIKTMEVKSCHLKVHLLRSRRFFRLTD